MLKILLSCVCMSALIPSASAEVKLAPHKITYDLKLKEASEKQGITQATGRMVFEYTGSACEGYTTQSRIVLKLNSRDGEGMTQDQRTTSFESSDDLQFRFVNNSIVNNVPKSNVAGEGKIGPEGAVVKLQKPQVEILKFDKDVKFPNGFLRDLVEQAKKGQTFITHSVYDGGDGGKILYNTSATIRPVKAVEGTEQVKSKLGTMAKWRVKVSYFDTTKKGDPLPDYSFAAVLYENGVTDDIVIDYGEMAFVGKTTSFELLPQTPCQ